MDDQAQDTQAPIRFNYYVTETRSLHIATQSCFVTIAADNRVLWYFFLDNPWLWEQQKIKPLDNKMPTPNALVPRSIRCYGKLSEVLTISIPNRSQIKLSTALAAAAQDKRHTDHLVGFLRWLKLNIVLNQLFAKLTTTSRLQRWPSGPALCHVICVNSLRPSDAYMRR